MLSIGQQDAADERLMKFSDLSGLPGFRRVLIALRVTQESDRGWWVTLADAPVGRWPRIYQAIVNRPRPCGGGAA